MPNRRSWHSFGVRPPSVDPFAAETAFSKPPSPGAADARPSPIEAFPRRRRLTPLLLFFGALALVGYFVFTAMDGVLNTNTLDARVVVLREEIDDLEWQADQLEALVAFLDSDEYIERVAREELGLVRVGEEAFAIQAPLRPGINVFRSPWWANLLPHPATQLETVAYPGDDAGDDSTGGGTAAPPIATTSAGVIP